MLHSWEYPNVQLKISKLTTGNIQMLHNWEYTDCQLEIPRYTTGITKWTAVNIQMLHSCEHPDVAQLGIFKCAVENIQMDNWGHLDAAQLGISRYTTGITKWTAENIQMLKAVNIQMLHSCEYPDAAQQGIFRWTGHEGKFLAN